MAVQAGQEDRRVLEFAALREGGMAQGSPGSACGGSCGSPHL